MAEKVTKMELKVDLQCEKCIKKLKKALCKFPQIRDQVFNEKQNIVIIKVVCCEPEKIRDKICSKGGGAIKSIKIVEEKKKPDEPKQEPKKTQEEPEKKKKQENQPKSESPSRDMSQIKPKPLVHFADPLVEELGPKSPVSKSAALVPVADYPSLVTFPFGMSCVPPYYEGGSGGLWFHGYYYASQPPHPPPIYYGGYYGKAVYDSYGGGGGRSCYVNLYEVGE